MDGEDKMDFIKNHITVCFRSIALAEIATAVLLLSAALTFFVSSFFVEPSQTFTFPPAMLLMGLAVLFQLRKGRPYKD